MLSFDISPLHFGLRAFKALIHSAYKEYIKNKNFYLKGR
jgi:hypothetical protein